MPVITNGNKEVKCTCGKHCKGLKGLKAHQRSCRIILGLHENLRNDLDEENYDDIDENTFGDTNDSNCTLTPGADPEKILTRSTLMASEASQKNIGGSGGTPPEKILKPNPLDWLRTLFQENFL